MTAYLTNQFLIAMPAMDDPNFAQTVTLVCEHSERGALGIVINRTLPMTLGDLRRSTPWVWLYCEARDCHHGTPAAIAPFIISCVL